MSKYTTELRFIINQGIDIFDFDYDFYSDEEKQILEKEFIQHFYFDEIGQETVGRFKLMLKDKFTLELPFYCELMKLSKMEYDILNNYDLKETFTRSTSGNSQGNGSGTTENNGTTSSSGETNNFNIYADTPQTEVDETFTHASNKSKDKATSIDNTTSNSRSSNSSNTTSSFNDTETYENHRVGNIGVQTQSDMLEKHIILQKKLKRIKKAFFEECEDLFMMVY